MSNFPLFPYGGINRFAMFPENPSLIRQFGEFSNMGLRFHIPSQSQSSFPDGSSKGYRFIYPPGKNRQEVENGVLTESRLDELMKIMDPSAELSPEVKIVLLDYVDEFVDKVIKKSADLAKLSGSRVVRPADAKFVLEHIYSE